MFVLLALPLLYSVIAHEVAHGVAALAFGDRTAQRAGRLTLNPLRHLDVLGTLMLFLAGFGWAKPVPVSYANLRPLRPGMFCVALAGCAVNIAIAGAAMAAQEHNLVHIESIPGVMLHILARVNLALAALNLLPIPPLDGSKVLMSVLPAGAVRGLAVLERYGLLILIALLLTGRLDPLITWMEGLILRFV